VPRPYSDAYLHVRLFFAKSSGVGVLIPKKGTANKGGLRTADKLNVPSMQSAIEAEQSDFWPGKSQQKPANANCWWEEE